MSPATAHLPVQWHYAKPAQLNSERDPNTVLASKINKGQYAGNTQNTVILANRLRSDLLKYNQRYNCLLNNLWLHAALILPSQSV